VTATPSSFATTVARLHAELARDGLPVSDMRRAASLELQMAGVPDYAAPSARPAPKSARSSSRNAP
jgi:hypothetical protein